MSIVRGARKRGRQFLIALHVRSDARADAQLRRLCPNEAMWQLLARLSPFDRRHALAVHDWMLAHGVTDTDLLLAGLLHDVGKADERTRVHLSHRVALVVGRRFIPDWLDRACARPGAGGLRRGLYLAKHHAALGAERAAAAGASARCCALIAAHDSSDPSSDPQLRLLRSADEHA